MRIDWAQTETILRDEAASRKARPTGECPRPEDLAAFVEGKTGRKARAKTLEHLANCGDCAKIVRSLLHLAGEVDRLTGEPGAPQGYSADQLQRGEGTTKPPLRWRMALGTLALLAGLAIVSVFVIRLSERPVIRGTSGVEIKLTNPQRGEAIASRAITYTWEAVPQSSRYVVDLFGPSLEKIFSSEPVITPSFDLPADVGQTLVAGQAYFSIRK
jgi:hypothetical protein